MDDRTRTWGPAAAVVAALPLAFVALRAVAPGIGPREAPAPVAAPVAAPAEGHLGLAGSASCAACHPTQHAAWTASTHARAERQLGDADPRELAAVGPDGALATFPLVRAIGADPLVQYLVAGPGGRLQVTQVARPPAGGDWFDVFSDARKPGDWGHWTGAGMTWNARCGECHTTQFRKGFAAGAYTSTYSELGVGCEACHVAPAGHGADATSPVGLDGCAACHARRAALVDGFAPGDALLDRFAPALVDASDTFRPDGGVRDEDFEVNAFLGSRMHAAGVTCTNCHDPHSGRLRQEGDALCRSCHDAMPTFRPDHGHHAEGQVSCVQCHMPATTYMQVDVRHDHVFSIPDPALEREVGVSSACSTCHPAGPDLVKAAQQWWGRGLPQPRSLAFARARQTDDRALPELLHQLATGAPAWRAAAAAHLGPWLERPEVRAALVAALADPDGLVRFAVADALGPVAPLPEVEPALHPLLADPVRAVRVSAGRALRGRFGPGSAQVRDYAAYLDLHADDPAALLERGSWALERREYGSARMDLEAARALDPASPAALDALAVLAASTGRQADALQLLTEAVALDADDPELRFRLALAQVEAGDPAAARRTLGEVVARHPTFLRAWYNLGLLESRDGGGAGVQSLRRAVELAPADPEVRYALAAVLAATDPAAARAEARRVLALDPAHAGAAAIAGGAVPGR